MKSLERLILATALCAGSILVLSLDASAASRITGATSYEQVGALARDTIMFRGDITAYSAASGSTTGTISVENHVGATLQLTVTSATVINEVGGTGDAPAVGDRVTVQAATSAPTVATTIWFHVPPPIKFRGLVTAYTAATSSTMGTVALQNRAGATLDFSTTLSTTITEVGGTGASLVAGDNAVVDAEASAPTIATSIKFSLVTTRVKGTVTAYTAADGATDGSITLQTSLGASDVFATTSTTTITETRGSGQTLTVGDDATVDAAAVAPTVATSISFKGARDLRFSGTVTAYAAATSTTSGSITLQRHRHGAAETFTTTSTTTVVQLGGTGATLAVGDHATVDAAPSAPTAAASITYLASP